MDLTHAAIVVAHPDDEILWFSSLVTRVAHIVICYGAVEAIPERRAQRQRVIGAYPLPNVEFLDLTEPGAVSGDADAAHQRELAKLLPPLLAGVTTVFTHNPWGEYGHLDHRRLNAVIEDLSKKMDFAVYVSSYAARHQLGGVDCALNGGIGEVVSFPVDERPIREIFQLYRTAGCWTWTSHWKWPKDESFLRLGEGANLRPEPFSLHLFDLDAVIRD